MLQYTYNTTPSSPGVKSDRNLGEWLIKRWWRFQFPPQNHFRWHKLPRKTVYTKRELFQQKFKQASQEGGKKTNPFPSSILLSHEKISTRLFDILFQFGYFSGSGGRQTRLTFTSVTKQHSARTRRGLKNRLGDVSNQRADEDKAASLPVILIGPSWQQMGRGWGWIHLRWRPAPFQTVPKRYKLDPAENKNLRKLCEGFVLSSCQLVHERAAFRSERLRRLGQRNCALWVKKTALFAPERLCRLSQRDCSVWVRKIAPFESDRLRYLGKKECHLDQKALSS